MTCGGECTILVSVAEHGLTDETSFELRIE